jgi:hypothetical protein
MIDEARAETRKLGARGRRGRKRRRYRRELRRKWRWLQFPCRRRRQATSRRCRGQAESHRVAVQTDSRQRSPQLPPPPWPLTRPETSLLRRCFFSGGSGNNFFWAVGEKEWPGMAGIFIRAGPTEQNFVAQTIFLRAEFIRLEMMSSRPGTAQPNEALWFPRAPME